jgi:hypothetical protein
MKPSPTSDTLKKVEVEQIARAARLSVMCTSFVDQLAKSIEKSRFHISQLPEDLAWDEEIAVTFRPDSAPGAQR